jgi:hypothetical protein
MGAMTLTLVMVFAILPALVLGFLCGRIWQIRSDELQRRASFTPPSVAGIPLPRDANGHAPASAARCRWKPDNRLDQSGTADLFAKSTPAKSSRLARKSTSVTSRPTSPEKLLMGEP